jgi:glyoxylase-like metal-dependent hydrolase (beta-lactamase superfamily II)
MKNLVANIDKNLIQKLTFDEISGKEKSISEYPELAYESFEAIFYLEKLLITHGHLDHCGQAGMLAQELDLKIEGPHEDDRFWIEKLDDDGARYGMEAHSFEPDRWLVDGDTVTVGNLTLDVIHCPGHTPGHIIFHHGPSRLAIVGDVLFQGSIGRTDFPRGNHADLINAITTKLWPLGDDITFIPGHGPTSQFGYERLHNAFVADDVLAAR